MGLFLNGKYRKLGQLFSVTLAQLKAVDVQDNESGELATLVGGLTYQYDPTSVLAADDIFVIAPGNNQAGRYVLAQMCPFDIALPINAALADAAVLAAVPAGWVLAIGRCYWEITANWTGGSSSTIGLSSSVAPHSTKGDLLGGAAGDTDATLTAANGKVLGTVGADLATGILIKGAANIRHDLITSDHTAGTGFAHLVGTRLA
jgi:hypothetical protein